MKFLHGANSGSTPNGSHNVTRQNSNASNSPCFTQRQLSSQSIDRFCSIF